MDKKYKCLIIGAGHAGLEAAFALAKKQYQVALFTTDPQAVGNMPCNPSIGGPAKGIVTREIDALGGIQAIAADANQLQMKMLNQSKGPGVWALRAQIDKVTFAKWFQKQIAINTYIDLIALEVAKLAIQGGKIKGLYTTNNLFFAADYVIIATGTFLDATIHIGNEQFKKGPDQFQGSYQLCEQIKQLGFQTHKLKTGTPPRILSSSIDYSQLSVELGTNQPLAFSHFNQQFVPFADQLPCYLAHTNAKVHALVFKNIKQSAMYSGYIQGTGPRYCPSIEDKVVRFADKNSHQIFVEPESKSLPTMYLAGLSSSLPRTVQEAIVHSIKGFEQAKIVKHAYAIEYEAISSLELKITLESKRVAGLFFAGQINGTSGYEEAACQGLMAAINVICQLEQRPPFILRRDEAYIGVLLEDLVNKEVVDPYRLLTSRAEHRLQLRNDNADDRLLKYGYELGLISKVNWQQYCAQKQAFDATIQELSTTTLKKAKDFYYPSKKTNVTLKDLLKQKEHNLNTFANYLPSVHKLDAYWQNKVEIHVKYEGYIATQNRLIANTKQMEQMLLTSIRDYALVPNISYEAVEKLNKIKPMTLGQAFRISGVNWTDLIHIKFYLEHIHHQTSTNPTMKTS